MADRRTTDTPAPAIWRGSTVESALRLDATALIRATRERHPELWARWLSTGDAALLPVRVPVARGGVAAGEINVTVALHGLRGATELPNGMAAALVVRPTNIRGLRWWWLCPRTGGICAALYLPDGAVEFLSRQGHGLRYRSLSERPAERAARRARKLRAKLGDAPAVLSGPLPDRPLGMRAATYAQVCDAIQEAEERVVFAARLLSSCL